MRRYRVIAAAVLVLAAAISCKKSSPPAPVVVRVLRDPIFAADLTRFEAQFARTNPTLRRGRPVQLQIKDDVSYVDLLKRLNATEASVLILNSAVNVPNDATIGARLGSQTLVCGVHPAFVPASVDGEQREAAQMYVQFLAAHCTQSLTQAPTVPQPAQAQEPDQPDPHRPPCTTARCAKIKQFLKDHYCGDSPFGNGPDDGCDVREIPTAKAVATVTADFNCVFDEQSAKSTCTQTGKPSPELQTVLLDHLRHLGLPAHSARDISYKVVESAGLSLAAADYSHLEGSEVSSCSVIVLFGPNGQVRVIREVQLHKTNADVSDDTSYWPLDIADVDGDGRLEIILKADAYEDHWFEVVEVNGNTVRTIYSGMGYYL